MPKHLTPAQWRDLPTEAQLAIERQWVARLNRVMRASIARRFDSAVLDAVVDRIRSQIETARGYL